MYGTFFRSTPNFQCSSTYSNTNMVLVSQIHFIFPHQNQFWFSLLNLLGGNYNSPRSQSCNLSQLMLTPCYPLLSWEFRISVSHTMPTHPMYLLLPRKVLEILFNVHFNLAISDLFMFLSSSFLISHTNSTFCLGNICASFVLFLPSIHLTSTFPVMLFLIPKLSSPDTMKSHTTFLPSGSHLSSLWLSMCISYWPNLAISFLWKLAIFHYFHLPYFLILSCPICF